MHVRTLLAIAATATVAAAQDFIHYKFDSPCTTEVINHATGASAFPANGVLENNTGSPYTTGIFGGALQGGPALTSYNRVRTGWDPGVQNVTGDLTVAWFMRQRTAPGTSLTYLLGAPSGGHRMFTNGIAGRGLYQRVILAGGGNGINASIANDFYLPVANADIQTLAAANWVHVAMVVDSVAQTADWYVNGVSVLQLAGVPGALISAPGPYTVGYYSNASLYDFDEFLISLRAYGAAEILALSLAPQAGDGDYSSGIAAQCGTLGLSSVGGRPFLGNGAYGLQISTSATGFYALLFGFDRCLFAGTFTLPLDAGLLSPLAAGCSLLTDIASSAGGLASGANVTVPFGIPNVAIFSGQAVYAQAALLDLVTSVVSASNGWAIGVGN